MVDPDADQESEGSTGEREGRVGLLQRDLVRLLRFNIGKPDELIYEINGRRVILMKAAYGCRTDDPFRTLHEWNSKADAKAYGKL